MQYAYNATYYPNNQINTENPIYYINNNQNYNFPLNNNNNNYGINIDYNNYFNDNLNKNLQNNNINKNNYGLSNSSVIVSNQINMPQSYFPNNNNVAYQLQNNNNIIHQQNQNELLNNIQQLNNGTYNILKQFSNNNNINQQKLQNLNVNNMQLNLNNNNNNNFLKSSLNYYITNQQVQNQGVHNTQEQLNTNSYNNLVPSNNNFNINQQIQNQNIKNLPQQQNNNNKQLTFNNKINQLQNGNLNLNNFQLQQNNNYSQLTNNNNKINQRQNQSLILNTFPQQQNNSNYILNQSLNYYNNNPQQISNQDLNNILYFNNRNNSNLKTSQNNNYNVQQPNNNDYQIDNNNEPKDNSKINVVLDELTKPRGLENVGATCYMNATLQCFYHVRKLSETLINDFNINNQLEMTYCYKNLIEELSGCKDRKKYRINREYQNQYDDSKNYVKPEEFKELIGRKNPLFKGINANDSKDLVIFMLENMDAELTKRNNRIPKMEIFQGDDERQLEIQNFKKIHNSIVSDLFYGFQKTTMMCKNCQDKNISYSVFNFLLFPLEKIYNSLNQKNKVNKKNEIINIMRNNFMKLNYMSNNYMNMYNMNNNMNNMNNFYNMNNMNNFNNMNNMFYLNNNNNMNSYYYMNNYNYMNNMVNMKNFKNINNIFNRNSLTPYNINMSNNYYKQQFDLNNINGMIKKFNSPTNADLLKNIPDLPKSLALEKCFEEFEVEELLSGENQIYCNKCQRSSDAITKTEIYKSPNVLIIILNRGRGNVFECDVKFGLSLDINKFAKKNDSPKIYDLIGVISHLGESSMEGHFIAFCKHFSGNWILFNDAIVTNVSENDIFRGTPYILFYQNRYLA